MHFKDYFSKQAPAYTKFRPNYPPSLFQHLAGLVVDHERAWDCATGSGQAALGLLPFFHEVIATDVSENQIAHAVRHSKIEYAIAPAEETNIESHSIDLIVVAQALHWFDLDRFYAEADRVLKPGGIIAVWCYGLLSVSPDIDEIIHRFYRDIVGPFWPPERKLVEDRYQTIAFPFPEKHAPHFSMEATWRLDHLIGYLGTWSSVQRFKNEYDADPLEKIIDELQAAWGRPEREMRITWPIHMRVGGKWSRGLQ